MAGRDVSLAQARGILGLRRADDGEAPSLGLARSGKQRDERLRFRVLEASSARDLPTWVDAWQRWPDREVMAHPEYGRLFARPADKVVAVLGEGEGATVLLPLLLQPLAAEPWATPGEDRWDATTPYGYGGPFAWGEGMRDAAAFWRSYEEWCREARIVCTFARLSLFPEQLAPLHGRVEVRLPNVVVPLGEGIDAAWRNYDRDVRRRLRVARREGVTAEVDAAGARVAEFHEIYSDTMRRRGADVWYQLPLAFFEAIVERMRGRFVFVHALAGGRVLSSELALVSARHVYAFLGGTRAEAFSLYPNDLVRHATAEWAAAEGKARYVLGGGRCADDGIYRHKRLLAPTGEVPFRTASLVHDELAYHALARRRDGATRALGLRWKPRAGFFPVYRG